MTREELQARAALLDAQARELRAPADRYNKDIGWLGRLTGDGISLREYQPMRGGLAMNAYGATNVDKGDNPKYYDVTRELYDTNKQLRALEDKERKAQLEAQKQAALQGKSPADANVA